MGLVIKGAECEYAECTRRDWIWPGMAPHLAIRGMQFIAAHLAGCSFH